MQKGMFDFKSFFHKNRVAITGGTGALALVLILAAAFSGSGKKTVEETEASENVVETSAVETTEAAAPAKGFYQKLSAGESVNVLVLGDSFLNGTDGETADNSFITMLEEAMSEKYEDVSFDIETFPKGNGVYSGYVTAKQLVDPYDAVILAYGMDDTPEVFPVFYEAMLRAIRTTSPEAAFIMLSDPSSVTAASGNAQANKSEIAALSDAYHAVYLDLGATLSDAASTAGTDGLYQNADGQKAMADAVLAKIDEEAAAGATVSTDEVAPVTEGVEALDSFVYISSGEFTEVNDTTYELTADMMTDEDGNPVMGVLGIDYSYLTGSNDVYITSDGEPFGRHTVDYSGMQAAQQILPVNDNLNTTDHLTVVFGTPEEAGTFTGIILSGNVTLPDSYDQFESMDVKELSAEELDDDSAEDDSADDGGISAEDVFGPEVSDEENEAPAPAPTTASAGGYQEGQIIEKDGVKYEYSDGQLWELEDDSSQNETEDAGVVSQGTDRPGYATSVVRNKIKIKVKTTEAATGDETTAAAAPAGPGA